MTERERERERESVSGNEGISRGEKREAEQSPAIREKQMRRAERVWDKYR